MKLILSVIVWLVTVTFLTLFFPLSLLVWIVTTPFDRERVVTHWMLVFQGNFLVTLMPIWRIDVRGRKKADKKQAYVIISNHQSILDIIVLNKLWLKLRWISKIENYRVPFIGWYLRMARYITIDRGNKESKAEMMKKSAETLRKGISIMIFPEGTRSPDAEIALFKQGAFELAMLTDKPLLPVIIDGTAGVLPKHGLLFSGGHKLKIKVLDPVYPWDFGTGDPTRLAERMRKEMVFELEKMRNGL